MVGNQSTFTVPKTRLRQRLCQWFRNEPGNGLSNLEHAYLDLALSNLFGYHILQVGNLNNVSLISNSRISHKLILDFFRDNDVHSQTNLIAYSEHFPIESETMDVVVMPHTLEFESSPHQVLREANRVLIGEGHVVITGFNPWSLWGLWRLLLAWRDEPPWSGKFIPLNRIKDWLSLLDFEVIESQHFYFRPPFKNARLMNGLLFMEKMGKYLLPFLGGVYIIVARKRVETVTPIKLRWKKRRRLISSGLIKPSTNANQSKRLNKDQ